MEFPPFYVGQRVVGSNSVLPGSRVKKGHPYTITHVHLSVHPADGIAYWYVGYDGIASNAWLTPRLFTPIKEEFIEITLSEVLEEETKLVSVN